MKILHGLEKGQSGLSEALTGFHALMDCDLTSAFHGKGKSQTFLLLKKSEDHVLTLCYELVDLRKLTSFYLQNV